MPDFAGDTTTELERKIGPFKVVCLLETASYLLLLTVWLGLGSHIGTMIVGSVHGMIVTAFALMVVFTYQQLGWTWQFATAVVITGPVGAMVVYDRLRRWEAPSSAHRRAGPTMEA